MAVVGEEHLSRSPPADGGAVTTAGADGARGGRITGHGAWCGPAGAVRRVVLRQADLDTVVAAYVLGVSPDHPVTAVAGEASPEDLADPAVLCLECGGAGLAARGNFDHHDPAQRLPPACVQALTTAGGGDGVLRALVTYAAAVDEGRPLATPRRWPDLSSLISGVRLVRPDPVEAFREGLAVVGAVCRDGLDPCGPLPERLEWAVYRGAKEENRAALEHVVCGALLFSTALGRLAGYLESPAPGVHGVLRGFGCEIGLVSSPPLGPDGRRKYSLAAPVLRVDGYLPALNVLEPGWGGPSHGTIVGSPFTGSHLTPDQVIRIVVDDRWFLRPPGAGSRRLRFRPT